MLLNFETLALLSVQPPEGLLLLLLLGSAVACATMQMLIPHNPNQT